MAKAWGALGKGHTCALETVAKMLSVITCSEPHTNSAINLHTLAVLAVVPNAAVEWQLGCEVLAHHGGGQGSPIVEPVECSHELAIPKFLCGPSNGELGAKGPEGAISYTPFHFEFEHVVDHAPTPWGIGVNPIEQHSLCFVYIEFHATHLAKHLNHFQCCWG